MKRECDTIPLTMTGAHFLVDRAERKGYFARNTKLDYVENDAFPERLTFDLYDRQRSWWGLVINDVFIKQLTYRVGLGKCFDYEFVEEATGLDSYHAEFKFGSYTLSRLYSKLIAPRTEMRMKAFAEECADENKALMSK